MVGGMGGALCVGEVARVTALSHHAVAVHTSDAQSLPLPSPSSSFNPPPRPRLGGSPAGDGGQDICHSPGGWIGKANVRD